jgi:hypothetical protein
MPLFAPEKCRETANPSENRFSCDRSDFLKHYCSYRSDRSFVSLYVASLQQGRACDSLLRWSPSIDPLVFHGSQVSEHLSCVITSILDPGSRSSCSKQTKRISSGCTRRICRPSQHRGLSRRSKKALSRCSETSEMHYNSVMPMRHAGRSQHQRKRDLIRRSSTRSS